MNDPEIREGARNAVRVCMNVRDQDRVLVITDDETAAIGQALADEAVAAGAPTALLRLETYSIRPITDVPSGLVPDVEAFAPTVTFYAASSQPGEVSFRMELGRRLHRLNVRHGHMPSIDARLMREGMRADYQQVHDLTMTVYERVRRAHTLHVSSPNGTDFTARLSEDLHWVPCHGLYHAQGDWGNLPEGEVYTCPATAGGILVAEVIGDYFSPKYGVLTTPVTIELVDGWAKALRCEDKALETELWQYLHSDENSLRVGELAVGTNTVVHELTGNLLQDEKIPGIHVAFGNPYPEQTGADWRSSVHVDVIPTECSIEIDSQPIMVAGKFVI